MDGLIQMDGLIACIENCKGNSSEPQDIQEVFMYVKNYCRFSKAAATESAKYKTLVLDLKTKCFVSPEDIKQPLLEQEEIKKLLDAYNKKLLDAYKILKEYASTVPQVFVRDSGGWVYVGGSENFIALITASNNTSTPTQSMTAGFQAVKF